MPDLSGIKLDTHHLVEIPLQSQHDNKSDESLLVLDDRILTIFEVKGQELNPHPVAHVFDYDLNSLGTVVFPHIEYRVTDATLTTDGTHFWVINSFFPGDQDLLPHFDPLTTLFPKDLTHSKNDTVERLVEMQYSKSEITLTNTAPVQLTLSTNISRNWEGLVLLEGRGFLLITDKFPETILAFVPMP
jgi:hypothetical protein